MNNISYPLQNPARKPPKTRQDQLISSMESLRDQTADAVYAVDRLAMLSGDHSQRCYLNGLGSGLEVFAAQLEYHFPDGCREVELDEWAHILAVLNSASEWIDEQLLEIDLRLESDELSAEIQDLAHSYSARVPEVIAARFESAGAAVARREASWPARPTTPHKSAPSGSGVLAISP